MSWLQTNQKKKMRSKRKKKKHDEKKKAKGIRFTPEEKGKALNLVDQGFTKKYAANEIGTTTQSVLRWSKKRDQNDTSTKRCQPHKKTGSKKNNLQERSPQDASSASKDSQPQSTSFTPLDPGSGLADYEVQAILDLKKKHPSFQPAQIRAQLKRFKGWRISVRAIARVFKQEGYSLVHRGSRPEGPEPIRYEAPRRNALWHMDFTEVRIMEDKLFLLLILDDFSRYITGHALSDAPTGEVAIETLKAAIQRHGKPESLRTDRGGSFVTYHGLTPFGRYLEAELIDHIIGKPYRPQGGGKVEAAIGSLKRELWNVFHFSSREEAIQEVSRFIDEYNHQRAHMGIDGVTPADRFFGRADKVLALINAISRKRQGALDSLNAKGSSIEELGTQVDAAPLEVLRLVIAQGVMELRFCGARVKLGPVVDPYTL